MPTLTIDGKEVTVEPGATVLQACEAAGVEVPRFCYHERLSIAGNCRMCLVEVKPGPPKPAASCALPAGDGMEVLTTSPMAIKARQGVMEFLLANHPLDCPICDQGGECDLQDQAMAYGKSDSRYIDNKRAVPMKDMGPLIRTEMTRCIHCTRCVRFADEVAGVPALGAIGRGEWMEITTFKNQSFGSELSGCIVDLCPVGALTSRPYAFTARPWELKKTESIDVHDAVGSNIRVDARGNEVMRFLPVVNDEVNEEWISDKTRFAWDGLRRQRLDTPYVRRDGKLDASTWPEAFEAIKTRLAATSGAKCAAIAGDLMDVEAIVALKDLMGILGSGNMDCRQDGAKLDPSVRASYLFNSTIEGIEEADALLIVGANPRTEAAVLNARIRKRYVVGGFPIALLGEAADLTYKYDHLGNDPQTLNDLTGGAHPFAEVLRNAEHPMIILGQAALARDDGAQILKACRDLAESTGMVSADWNGFNVLHTAAARVGALDVGFVPQDDGKDVAGILSACQSGEIEVLYLLGADEIDMDALGDAFVIYQGTHGDAGAHRADVILPGAAYTEKSGTFVNTEGRVQVGRRAIFPPGDAKEDWTILRALSEVLGQKLPYDSVAELRARIVKEIPHLGAIGETTKASWGEFGDSGPISASPIGWAVADFYLTNPITRASPVMADCSATFQHELTKGTGTDG